MLFGRERTPATILVSSATQELLQRAAARDGLRALGDDLRAGARGVVAALDQQPLRLRTGAGALQREAAVELLAVQHEDGMAALERRGPRDAAALLVGAAVPDDHAAEAALPLVVVVL